MSVQVGPIEATTREDRPRARRKVLVLAYVISPFRGSEYSVAWNFVTQMSRWCDITVLFGASGPHMGDVDEIQDYLRQHAVPNVRFVPVAPGRLANLLNQANRKGWLTYSFYFAYRLWHQQAYRRAVELVRAERFDLVHYLGPIGYREPGYLWQLGLPYVWGPIGGANNLPRQLAAALPWSGKLKLTLRAAVNWFQLRFSWRVRRALSRVDVLLTATTENQALFRDVLGKDSLYLPENGIVGPIALDRAKFADLGTIQLIWIGSVEARKALRILVEALARCRTAGRFRVHVVGDGPLRAGLEAQVRASGLAARFVWHGQVARGQVQALLARSHLHVVTSVSEGNPTTIWEAMSRGVPTLTIDHCGMHDTVTAASGIKIPLSDYDGLVEAFARRLDDLAARPEQLTALAEGVLAEAPRHHWDRRPAFFLARYEEAIQARRARPANATAGQERTP